MSLDNISSSQADLISLLALVQAGKVVEAISVLKAIPSPIEASLAFNELSQHTYRDLHDVSSMVALANAGTQFALLKAASFENSADSEKLKKSAKVLAFNAAANCWPGWGDVGIDIKTDHLQEGLQLAILSRDLVAELNLGHKERGNAHWLIGALHLALGQYAIAVAEFQRSKAESQAGADSNCVLLADGYMALVLKAQPDSRLDGDDELARILVLLGNQGSKEAQFFSNQLITADRVLIRPKLSDVE